MKMKAERPAGKKKSKVTAIHIRPGKNAMLVSHDRESEPSSAPGGLMVHGITSEGPSAFMSHQDMLNHVGALAKNMNVPGMSDNDEDDAVKPA